MAYNVFKRPMFKRGGSTQGTGIMSHVEPRKKFNLGSTGLISQGMAYEAQANPGGGQLSNLQKGDIARKNLLSNLQKYGRTGLDFLKSAGQRSAGFLGLNRIPGLGTGATMAAPFAPVGIMSYLNRPKTDVALDVMRSEPASTFDETGALDFEDYSKRLQEAEKQGKEIGFLDIFKSPKKEEDIKEVIEDTKEDKTTIVDEIDIPETKEKPTEKPEEPKTFEDTYETEKKRIEKLIGDDDNKGMVAIALSEAIKTPGTLADKAGVLNSQLLKIMAGKKKDKRDIAKLAYTATKEIEKAKIAAGKESYSEKMANEVRKYQTVLQNPKATKADKDYAQQQLSILKKTINTISPKARDGLTAVDTKLLDALGKAAGKVKRLSTDPTSDAYKKALDQYNLVRLSVSKNPDLLDLIALTDAQIGAGQGLKDGGRVNRAMGTPESGETPTAPVQNLSFAELRNRLPREITDDVIRLISSSEEALQDFAYIRTQGDVNKFNMKYGVNAVLPAQA